MKRSVNVKYTVNDRRKAEELTKSTLDAIFVFGRRHNTRVMSAYLSGDPAVRPPTSRGRRTGGPLRDLELLL